MGNNANITVVTLTDGGTPKKFEICHAERLLSFSSRGKGSGWQLADDSWVWDGHTLSRKATKKVDKE